MASFADPSDLAIFYDTRRICELISDTGAKAVAADLDTNPVVLAMLARATETILSHVRKGRKYSEEELQTLADSTTSGMMLTGLTCDLAYGYLVMRRGTGAADMDRLSPNFRLAMATLKEIADGSEVFPRITGDAHEDAGTPRVANLTTQTTSPNLSQSWSAQANRRLIPNSPLTQNPYGNGNC